MTKSTYAIIACFLISAAAYCADVVLGKIGDITFTGSGTDFVAVFGTPAPSGWTDPNSYVALWEMETTNTTQTLDTSGNSNNASNKPSVASGPAWTIVGTNQYSRVEHGYTFSGANNFQANDQVAFTLGTNATIGCWIKTTDSKAALISHFDSGGAFAGFEVGIGVNPPDTGKIQLWDGTAFRTFGSDPVVNDNVWHLTVIVLQATQATLYIDGVAISTVACSSIADSSNDLFIGRDSNTSPSRYLSGLMDMPFIIPSAISSNSVYALYQNTHPNNNIRIRP